MQHAIPTLRRAAAAAAEQNDLRAARVVIVCEGGQLAFDVSAIDATASAPAEQPAAPVAPSRTTTEAEDAQIARAVCKIVRALAGSAHTPLKATLIRRHADLPDGSRFKRAMRLLKDSGLLIPSDDDEDCWLFSIPSRP